MWLALFSTVIFALDRDSRRWKLPKTVFFSCSVSSSAAFLEEMLGKIREEKRRGGEDRLKVKQRGVVFYVVEAGVAGVDAFRVLGFPEDGPNVLFPFAQTDAL